MSTGCCAGGSIICMWHGTAKLYGMLINSAAALQGLKSPWAAVHVSILQYRDTCPCVQGRSSNPSNNFCYIESPVQVHAYVQPVSL